MPTVTCPTCKRQSEYSTSNPWRPFCSERCKLIDLGDWASGKHAIAGEAIADDSDDSNPNDDPTK